MTPKEKSKELADKFKRLKVNVFGCSDNGVNPCISTSHMFDIDAKQCALICVDEILESYSPLEYYPEDLREYWREVKQEIEKL